MQNKFNGKKQKSTSSDHNQDNGMESSQLMKLFVDELKDIYWAEKALLKAIPKMIKNATSEELIEALQEHLEETEQHVKRAEEVFELINVKAVGKKCEAMTGLIKEAGEIMEECEAGSMCDAGIISAAQKVEHYEIATYGTLCTWATLLGYTDALELLKRNLNEEEETDEVLSAIAESVNVDAQA